MLMRPLLLTLALVTACAQAQMPSSAPSSQVQTTPLAPAPVITPRTSGMTADSRLVAAAHEDYRIGPQDLLTIQVYGIDGLNREVRVNSRGAISLPLIGVVAVGGLTGQEAESLIAMKYAKDYLQDPQVSVFIKEFTSQRITIEGAVQKAGVYPIRGQTTLLQALAIAGGQGSLANMSEVLVFRNETGERKTLKFDVLKIRSGDVQDPVLVNEDVVVVNRSGNRVALKDSLFRDILDTVNPFTWMRP